MLAVPMSLGDPANAEEGIPLLPLPADSRAARADTKVAQWLAALNHTALAKSMAYLSHTPPHRQCRDMDSLCHPASQVNSLKHRMCSLPIPTSSRNMLIGTRASPVVLAWPTAIPACCAQHIYARNHRTFTSTAKTPRNTLTWAVRAAQSSGTRLNYLASNGLGQQRIAM